ncbi:MAG: hypothetical protein ACRDI3_03745 [Actinomycetota bacterium]
MNTIRIGNDSRRLEEAEESWIAQQVSNRLRESPSVCVEVTIQTSTIQLHLVTPACGGGGAGGRAPRSEEAAIIELWNKHRLNSDEVSPGNVIAFIKQLRRHV